jgi:hypothetical protein
LPCPAADPWSPPQPPLASFARRVNAALESTPHECSISSASTSRWYLRPYAVADTLPPPPRLGHTQACSTHAVSTTARWTRPGLEHHMPLASLTPPPRPLPLWAPCCPFARRAESFIGTPREPAPGTPHKNWVGSLWVVRRALLRLASTRATEVALNSTTQSTYTRNENAPLGSVRAADDTYTKSER